MKAEQIKPTLFALLAAALYAVNSPLSKLLLEDVPATMMAALLYLGAGIGVSLMTLARKAMSHDSRELPLTKKELPYVVAMVLLDIAAPLCLMLGLTRTTAANASLLIAFAAGERLPALPLVLAALALGFVAYGLSITCYIYAQRGLGAARTSAWYAVSPFVDAGLSLLIFRQTPSLSFLAALAVMASGAWFAATDGIRN